MVQHICKVCGIIECLHVMSWDEVAVWKLTELTAEAGNLLPCFAFFTNWGGRVGSLVVGGSCNKERTDIGVAFKTNVLVSVEGSAFYVFCTNKDRKKNSSNIPNCHNWLYSLLRTSSQRHWWKHDLRMATLCATVPKFTVSSQQT